MNRPEDSSTRAAWLTFAASLEEDDLEQELMAAERRGCKVACRALGAARKLSTLAGWSKNLTKIEPEAADGATSSPPAKARPSRGRPPKPIDDRRGKQKRRTSDSWTADEWKIVSTLSAEERRRRILDPGYADPALEEALEGSPRRDLVAVRFGRGDFIQFMTRECAARILNRE